MMKRSASVAVAALLCGGAGAAWGQAVAPGKPADLTTASEGWTYFHKPGGTVAAHDPALRACLVDAERMRQPDARTLAGAGFAAAGPVGAAAVGAVQGVLGGRQEGKAEDANLENCMVAQGWDVVRLPDEAGDAIARKDETDQAKPVQALIAASAPQGTVVRRFTNEAARPGTIMAGRAGEGGKRSLSLASIDYPTTVEVPEAPRLPEMQKSAQPVEALTPEQLKAGAPAGTALVLVGIKGEAERDKGALFYFAREGRDLDTPGWVDGRPSTFVVGPVKRAEGAAEPVVERWLAYAVPPGTWRLSAKSQDGYVTRFCIRAPVFQAGAGQVLYAGLLNLTAAHAGPDTTTAAPEGARAALPGGGAGLTPAAWTMGGPARCEGAYIYAWDLPVGPPAPASAQPGTPQSGPLPIPPVPTR